MILEYARFLIACALYLLQSAYDEFGGLGIALGVAGFAVGYWLFAGFRG